MITISRFIYWNAKWRAGLVGLDVGRWMMIVARGLWWRLKRVDVNRWMSESDLSLLGTELNVGWGWAWIVESRVYTVHCPQDWNIINYIHMDMGIRKIDLCKLIILNLKRFEFKLYCQVWEGLVNKCWKHRL